MSISRIVTTERHADILAWERAVVLHEGVVDRVVGPGRVRRGRRDEIWVVDARAQRLIVPPQDVLTADGLQVKISVFAKYTVTDPARYLASATTVEGELHALIQLRLREAVSTVELAELLASRQSLFADALPATAEAALAMGVTLESLDGRDLTLPQELRRGFAETALAREAGKARLEAARGEAAALRSLANTAELLEKHPSLIQLRALEVAGAQGSQIVVRVGQVEPGAPAD